MKKAAGQHDFETATIIRNKLHSLRELQQQIMFGDKEFLDISKDNALRDLTDLLGLSKIPVRIEGYDISHINGVDVVASMVVFKNGVSDRAEYRKFKTHIDHNDDFYNINETINRRLSQKNLKNWGKPDLVLIDGGKGQLDAAIRASDRCEQTSIPFIGLAKKNEQIVISSFSAVVLNESKVNELKGFVEITDNFTLINLPVSTHIIKLLQRIRDESHRFAVSYHTSIKRTKQTASLLDEIPGIGPKTRSKLIRKFGSINGLKNASESEIVSTIGTAKAKLALAYLRMLQS